MNRVCLVSLLGLLGAVGCNESTSGAQGNILYTPDQCDVVGSGCTFDDSVVVGGNLIVHITGQNGVSTAGVDLGTDNPNVFTVTAVQDVGGQPAPENHGTSPP